MLYKFEFSSASGGSQAPCSNTSLSWARVHTWPRGSHPQSGFWPFQPPTAEKDTIANQNIIRTIILSDVILSPLDDGQ